MKKNSSKLKAAAAVVCNTAAYRSEPLVSKTPELACGWT